MRRASIGAGSLALASALASLSGCALAGLDGLEWRGPDAGAGEAGRDAASGGDGPDAGQAGDAGASEARDSGWAAPDGSPARECANAGTWCAARLPERDGGPPIMTSVAGTSIDDVWAAGRGGAIVCWDGKRWRDQSPWQDGANAGFPVSDVFTVSIGAGMVAYAGADRGGPTAKTACGWKYTSDPWSAFEGQEHCSGAEGFGWLASSQSGDTWVLAGEKGHFQIDNPTVLADAVEADYRAVHLRKDGEIWLAGSAGAVRHMTVDDTASLSAEQAGFPSTTTDFEAVFASDSALVVAGQVALFECARSGPAGRPALTDCRNHATGAQALHGLAQGSSGDLWAAGEESGRPLLLRRTGTQAWQPVEPPPGAGALFGVWRGYSLVVVAGVGGVFSSSAF